MSEPQADVPYLLHKIRYASEPDNPDLIRHWLHHSVPPSHSQAGCWQYYRLQYHLLLDTLNDSSLPLRWRCACLDAIYIPLQQLEKLAGDAAQKREVRRLYFEVTMCRHCCLPKKALH